MKDLNAEHEYFVMLTCQNGHITPMLNSEGEVAMYAAFESAVDDANRNVFGRHFGYEVFERGAGEHQG